MNPTNGLDVTTDGSSVSFWTNSVNNMLFTPLVWSFHAGTKVIYNTTSANGSQASLYWSNATYTAITAPTTNWLSTNWIFCVMRFTNSGDSAIDGATMPWTFGPGDGNAAHGSSTILWCVHGDLQQRNWANAGATNSSGFNYTNKWVLVSMRNTGTNNFNSIYTNGVLATTGSNGLSNITLAQGVDTCVIGGGASTSFLFRGYFGELLVYAGDMSSIDRQTVEGYLMKKYALPDTSSHPEVALVATPTLGSLRTGFTGTVGFSFTPWTDLYVTKVGRWVVSGNTLSHALTIFQSAGSQQGSTVTLNTSGLSVGFNYVATSANIFLKGGTKYIIESAETTSGDQWYDNNTTLTLSVDGNMGKCALSHAEGACAIGTAYGPPDLKYYTP
jgi:hypothetical protein